MALSGFIGLELHQPYHRELRMLVWKPSKPLINWVITVSTDLNYRKKLWKYGKEPGEVMPALVEGCDIILGNEEDAEKHFGLHPENVDVTQGDSVDAKA